MLSNNYNVASYKYWLQTTYMIIYLFLRKTFFKLTKYQLDKIYINKLKSYVPVVALR